MSNDQAALPVSAILLVALTVGVTGAATTVLLLDDPGDQPVTAGFMVKDETRFALMKTSGDALDAEPTRLYIGTPQGSVEVPAEEIPGIGDAWTNGKSVCIVGEGPRCLQIEGAETIIDVRVAHGDQTLYGWEGQPELSALDAGEGPRFSIGDTDEEDEGETGGQPDLRLVSLEPEQDDLEEDDEVAFEATIANVGDDASPATTLRIDVDDERHDTVDVPPLADGGSTTLTSRTWRAQAGQHDASGIVDPDAATDDPDPSNNADTASLAVAGEDPGHAYEDVDNDATFTPGTDQTIPDEEIRDGEYHVQDPWSLVIPASVDPITADEVNLTAGEEGHIVVETDLTSEDEGLRIDAGAYVRAANVSFTSDDEGIWIEATDGPIDVDGSTLDTVDERIELVTDGDVHAEAATLTTTDERVIVDAGAAVDLTDADIEASERIPITAGDDVTLADATLAAEEEITVDTIAEATVDAETAAISDEDDTAVVTPDDATIEGTPSEGDVAHEGGEDGGGGGPP